MSYWLEALINGREIVFTEHRIAINSSFDLSDPVSMRALRIAQMILPVICMAEDIHSNAFGIFTDGINWNYVSNDMLDELVTAGAQLAGLKAYLPKSVKAILSEAQHVQKYGYTSPKDDDTPKEKHTVEGYVYLIKSSTGYYKIGRTIKPDDRIATFSVKLPFEVEYEHLIQTDDMYGLERQLHERYANKRVNGEWFDLSTDDVAYIKLLGGE